MKEQDPIDGLFRRQLGNFELEPPMHLWPGVERRLPQGFPTLRSILLLAAISGVLTAWLCRDSRPESAASQESPLAIHVQPSLAVIPHTRHISVSPTPSAPITAAPEARAQSASSSSATEPVSGSGIASPVQKNRTKKRPIPLPRPILSEPASALLGEDHTSMAEAAEEQAPQTAEDWPTTRNFSLLSPLKQRAAAFEPYPLDDFLYQGITFLGERWYAGVELGVAHNWMERTLLAKGAEYEPYAQARNQSESLRTALTASLRLSLISASGLTLRSGIQLTQFSETFTQTVEEKQIRLIPRLDAGGNVIGTDTTLETLSIQNQHINRFQTVDIPITFGYEFSIGKTNIGLHGGPVLNMAFYQKGRFLAEDGKEVVDFSSSTPDAYPAFRNRLGLGLYGGVNLSHPITPSLHLFAEPYIRVFPESFTAGDYPLEQRYRAAGIFIGVRKLMGPYWMHIRP